MKRKRYLAYLLIVASLALSLNISSHTREKMRGVVFSLLSFKRSQKSKDESESLKTQNQMLMQEVDALKNLLFSEEIVEYQLELLKEDRTKETTDPFFNAYLKKRLKAMRQSIEMQMRSVSAQVIFREPALWSSILWINVGERDNHLLGYPTVAINSPVVFGRSIVGVVEYVGKKHSRVRLITDSRLVPSVRIVRGKEQHRVLLEHVELLLKHLNLSDEVFPEEEKAISEALMTLQKRLKKDVGERYLAKGELYGSSRPLWRSRFQTLKGVGFNYDFGDEETKMLEQVSAGGLQDPLFKRGDLLVTTGLDGVFPPGFHVGVVSKIEPLDYGAPSYALEAELTSGNLDELRTVSVLPPVKE